MARKKSSSGIQHLRAQQYWRENTRRRVWKLLVDAENYHQDWIERLTRAAEAAVAK